MNKKGFTLVELLVVIGVILILTTVIIIISTDIREKVKINKGQSFDKEIVFPDDNGDDNPKTKHFINVLTKSIEQYQRHIEKRKQIISELIDKETKDGLSIEEKNMLLSTQRELLSLDKMTILDVPETLISVDNLDKISQARKDAESFIKSLLEKNGDDSKE